MLHGGNFYGSHITHVADTVKLHLAHAAEVLERQLVLLCHSPPAAGIPENLIQALRDHGAKGLTLISNNAGNGDSGLAALLAAGRVRKVICSFPRQSDSYVFDGLYRAGKVVLEVVPQGNLAERMRAAGAQPSAEGASS